MVIRHLERYRSVCGPPGADSKPYIAGREDRNTASGPEAPTPAVRADVRAMPDVPIGSVSSP